MVMRSILRKTTILLIAAAMVTLAACGSGSPSTAATHGNGSATSTGSPASSGSSAPVSGGTLTIALDTNPVSLDPALEADWNSRQAIGYMYDTLMNVGPGGKFQPVLATSWNVSSDGLTYTFHLRKGVKFQDGTPFNAAAVAYNFDRMLNKDFNSKDYATLEPYIKSVKAQGDSTVVFHLKKPWANFLAEASWVSTMVSPTAARKYGANFYKHPVGTGPFMFKSYTPGSSLILVRNPNYWGGKVYLKEIKEEIIPDMNTQVLDVEAGKIDVMYAPPPKDVALLKKHGISIQERQTPAFSMLSLNVAKGPTADLAVRQAIAHAVDRQAIIQKVLYGYAAVSRAGLPKASPYYNADVPSMSYDPAKAKQTLDQGGWKVGKGGVRYKDGKPLAVTILATTQGSWGTISQILQQELTQVGFQAKIETQDWGTFLNSMRAGDYNIAYWYLGGFTNQASDGTMNMYSKAYWNVSQITKQPKLKSVMQQIDSLYNQEVGQADVTKRRALLDKFQQLMYKNEIMVWLWNPTTLFAMQPYVKGYQLYNFDFVWLKHAWLAKH